MKSYCYDNVVFEYFAQLHAVYEIVMINKIINNTNITYFALGFEDQES